MSSTILNCLLVFTLSIIFSGILIPQILLIAFRKKLFDIPDERKVHHALVPRLGGIAFTPVILFSISFMAGLACLTDSTGLLQALNDNALCICWGICALLTLYLLGMADDLVGVRYRAKFVLQIMCGGMLLLGGMGVTDYEGLLGINEITPWIGYPLTIFFMVFVINAINLIDGIDGLASGLSAIAFILYGTFYILADRPLFALICFASLGVLVPFYYFNVFGNAEKKKKIFMGDTGSLTIGLLLVFLGLHILNLDTATLTGIPEATQNRMAVVLSPLMVPCLDVVRVYFHRLRHHNNPFLPDKNHIHHKLLATGMRQRPAMVTIVSISLVFCIVNIYAGEYLDINLLLLADVLVWTLWNISLSRRIRRKETEQQN